MCSWNQYIIDKNLEKIRNRMIYSEDKNEIDFLTSSAEVYRKVFELMNQVISKEGENYIYPPSFRDNQRIDLDNNDIYHSNTIEKVSKFLMEFNPEYYNVFMALAKNGLISLHKNEDGKNVGEHFVDRANKTCFIYVSSNDSELESEELIRQFGYVYQTINNEIEYDESRILIADAFPNYLVLSMKYHYNNDLKIALINEIKQKNNKLFKELMTLNEKKSKNIKLKKMLANQISSNYMSLFMFLNNDIECSFKNVDEFVKVNNEDYNSSLLWSIANNNSEGINHAKEQILLKKKQRTNR